MVGVPFLARWLSGVSSRTVAFGWRDLSQRMIAGPHRKLTSRAVITAPPDRKVM
jgi:hypothetical protein